MSGYFFSSCAPALVAVTHSIAASVSAAIEETSRMAAQNGAIGVFPLPNRETRIARLALLRPCPPIGEDAAQSRGGLDHDVGRVLHDDDLHRMDRHHHARHRSRNAARRRRVTSPYAGGELLDIGFANGLVFGS